MFAALLSVGGVFFYSGYVEKQRDREISGLNADISSFNEDDMNEILKFDRRLQQAYGRVDNSSSIAAVFGILESVTVGPVEIQSLEIKRELDDKLVLTADIKTDSFDSTIFQRQIYNANDSITEVTIKDLDSSAIEGKDLSTVTNDDSGDGRPAVSFEVTIEVPLSEVPYVVKDSQPRDLQIDSGSAVIDDAGGDLIEDDNTVVISQDNNTEVNNLDI
jgi:hypothetical protein